MNKITLIILAFFLIISQSSASSSISQLQFCTYPSCRTTSQWVSNGKTPTYNGCSAGIFKGTGSGFDWTPCCNQHDICWCTCSQTQNSCDKSFKDCMLSKCYSKFTKWNQLAKKLQCISTAEIWFSAVSANKCGYIEVQKDRCECQ